MGRSRKEIIGANIRLQRHRAGLTSQELAERLGVDRRQVRRYENAHVEPSEARLQQLAEIFDVHWTHFYLEQLDLNGASA